MVYKVKNIKSESKTKLTYSVYESEYDREYFYLIYLIDHAN